MGSEDDETQPVATEAANPEQVIDAIESGAPVAEVEAEHTAELSELPVHVRSASAREVDIRIMPWDQAIEHEYGYEWFERGAFDGTDPRDVLLMGLDHETLMGIDRRGQPVIKKRPMGVAIRLWNAEDGQYGTFKVAHTASGDEFLALAGDGVVRGASAEWDDVPGGSVPSTKNGRRGTAHRKARLKGVSPTWRPAYERAGVVAMRSELEGDAVMAEDNAATAAQESTTEATPAVQMPDFSGFQSAMSGVTTMVSGLAEKIEGMEERYRSNFTPPTQAGPVAKPKLSDWASVAARMLVGQKVPDQDVHERALEDVVSPDNPGAVPDAFLNDLIGIVTPRRQFLASTRQIDPPETGLSITVPVLEQHTDTGVQSEEKTDITSQAFHVGTDTFDAITIAGGADVSVQLIRRGSRSFFDLLMRDLARSYAANADLEAVAALLAAGVTAGAAALDPENLEVGDAWANSIGAFGDAPDTVWLSSDAVASFIDAKDTGTNRPLYFNLNANFAAGTGAGGNVSALRPVYTPALDNSGTDVLIGPSDGFAWAEDGTFNLQVDVPSKAGRDVAIVGILFLIPRYPAAFTSYALAS